MHNSCLYSLELSYLCRAGGVVVVVGVGWGCGGIERLAQFVSLINVTEAVKIE